VTRPQIVRAAYQVRSRAHNDESAVDDSARHFVKVPDKGSGVAAQLAIATGVLVALQNPVIDYSGRGNRCQFNLEIGDLEIGVSSILS
jgi:hypothetical protein